MLNLLTFDWCYKCLILIFHQSWNALFSQSVSQYSQAILSMGRRPYSLLSVQSLNNQTMTVALPCFVFFLSTLELLIIPTDPKLSTCCINPFLAKNYKQGGAQGIFQDFPPHISPYSQLKLQHRHSQLSAPLPSSCLVSRIRNTHTLSFKEKKKKIILWKLRLNKEQYQVWLGIKSPNLNRNFRFT